VVDKIVSGGQTGVDRAALDVALAAGISCGGWCPKDRRAEDGVIADVYPLREADTEDYSDRTARNVRDADGTLILNQGPLEGGTALTVRLAEDLIRPCLIVDLDAPLAPAQVCAWLHANTVQVLIVAGPREGERPGIYSLAHDYLRSVLSPSGDDMDPGC
jgi:hypothetical protein